MSVKLYVGNLAYSVTDQDLEDFFAAAGTVTSAVVIKDKFSGQSKGFGFVEFEDDTAGKQAIADLNGKDLNGRALNVSEARPQEDRPPRREGGYNGGGNGGGYRGGNGGGFNRGGDRRRDDRRSY